MNLIINKLCLKDEFIITLIPNKLVCIIALITNKIKY